MLKGGIIKTTSPIHKHISCSAANENLCSASGAHLHMFSPIPWTKGAVFGVDQCYHSRRQTNSKNEKTEQLAMNPLFNHLTLTVKVRLAT